MSLWLTLAATPGLRSPVTEEGGFVWEISLSDILSLSDSLRKLVSQVLADGFTAQDSMARKEINKILEDAFFGSDHVIKTVNLVRGDSFSLTDDVLRNVEFFRMLVELLSLNEGLRKEFNKVLGDAWDASTFAGGQAGAGFERVMGDILTLADRVRLYTYPAHIDFTPPPDFSKSGIFRASRRPSNQRYEMYVVRHLHEIPQPNMFDVYVLQILQQLTEGKVLLWEDLRDIQTLMNNLTPNLHLHLNRFFRPVRVRIGG